MSKRFVEFPLKCSEWSGHYPANMCISSSSNLALLAIFTSADWNCSFILESLYRQQVWFISGDNSIVGCIHFKSWHVYAFLDEENIPNNILENTFFILSCFFREKVFVSKNLKIPFFVRGTIFSLKLVSKDCSMLISQKANLPFGKRLPKS